MSSQDFPKILKQKKLVKCVGVLESDLEIFYLNNADINLIQNDIYVRLSKISENKCQLLIAKKSHIYENYPQIIFKQYTDEKTARQEYKNIIEADKKRRQKIPYKIFSRN